MGSQEAEAQVAEMGFGLIRAMIKQGLYKTTATSSSKQGPYNKNRIWGLGLRQ